MADPLGFADLIQTAIRDRLLHNERKANHFFQPPYRGTYPSAELPPTVKTSALINFFRPFSAL